MQSSQDGEFAPFTSTSSNCFSQITSKNLYSKNGTDFIRMHRNPSKKIKKLSRPQGTEKLGDTTLINAYAFTHPTVNAGATPVISRNSEAGLIKGDVGISQPDRTPNHLSDSFSENVLISTIPHQRFFTIQTILGIKSGFVNAKNSILRLSFFLFLIRIFANSPLK